MGLSRQEEELQRRRGEPLLYAHVRPLKFPAKETGLAYPTDIRPNSSRSPLYMTTSTSYGEEPPSEHQPHDHWFPLGHEFTNAFTDRAPRDTGLVTGYPRSSVHPSMDGL